MDKLEPTMKKFAGVVHIADVQNEIDKLVNRINLLIGDINTAIEQSDFQPTKGATKLSGRNYTLTCAGLKRIFDLYGKRLIAGGKVVDVENVGPVQFPSLVFTGRYTGKQFPSKVSPALSSTDLYENVAEEGEVEEDLVHIAYLDWQRGENLVNTTQDNLFINPDKSPVVKLTNTQNNMTAGTSRPSNKAFFYSPQVMYGADSKQQVKIANTVIFSLDCLGWIPYPGLSLFSYNPIFIPKGCNNKVTFTHEGNGPYGHLSKVHYFSVNT